MKVFDVWRDMHLFGVTEEQLKGFKQDHSGSGGG